MNHELLIEQFFESLINGDRHGSRQIVQHALNDAEKPEHVITDLFWPAYEKVDNLYRHDQLSHLGFNFATRLLRMLVDQNAAAYEIPAPTRRSVFAACGPNDADELGAQMAVDLLETSGFQVNFAGGGIPGDEILAQVHEHKPDVLLLFASAPSDLPDIRHMIDSIREIGAVPDLQVVVGGGVFNRADGLAEEIGADLWSSNPIDLVDRMIEDADRRATEDQRTVGRKHRNKAAA